MKNKVVLIGGAPTVGKSFIARKLAEELKLPWISTDGIREIMRKMVRKDEYPELFRFYGETITAEKYLTTHSPKEIVDHQNLESEEVWQGVTAFIDTDYVWKQFIIEGVAVIPHLVSKLIATKSEILPIFLIEENENIIREVVFNRGLWDDAHKYSDDVKEIEVEWAMLFNQYILAESKKYGFKTFSVNYEASFIDQLSSLVKQFTY